MKLDLLKPEDYAKFTEYADKLIKKSAKVELKEIHPKRSISQNKYLHVVITLYAIAYGCNLNEAKTDLKRSYGLIYEKKGKRYLISSTQLDSKEMTNWITWIRNVAAKELNCYIPTSEEYLLDSYGIDKEIEKNKQHL